MIFRTPLKTALSIALLASLSACFAESESQKQANQETAQSSEVKKVTILHTNDHHGRFWHNRHGEYGMAARKTLIDELRAQAQSEGAAVLLLSGGDINTGVPANRTCWMLSLILKACLKLVTMPWRLGIMNLIIH